MFYINEWHNVCESLIKVIYKLYTSHTTEEQYFNPLNAKLNPICHLLAVLGAHHILHVSRLRVNYHSTTMQNSSSHRIKLLAKGVTCNLRP